MARIKDAFGFLLGAWRARPKSKRVIQALSIILALTGTGLLSFPLITDIYTNRAQGKLALDFESPQFRDQFRARQVGDGQVLTHLRIPSISVDALVVEGTDAASLRAGAGHYKDTAFPCEAGNVGIAGHRTTYGRPFNRIDELKVGDIIELITPEADCTYTVIAGPSRAPRPSAGAAGWITTPRDGSVIGPLKGSFLTLTTCHPKGSAAKRLIVRAELKST